jgi:hypothetical protein
MPERSAMERIKELDEERTKLFDEAKEEALQKATEAVAQLRDLGLNYTPVNGDAKKATSAKEPVRNKGSVKEARCSVCGFETSPPHDARKHRGQIRKKPFTAAELTDMGLEKV